MRVLYMLQMAIVASIAFTDNLVRIPLSDNTIDINLSSYITDTTESVGYTISFTILSPTRGEIRYDGRLINTSENLAVRLNTNLTISLAGGYSGPKFNFSVAATNSLGNSTSSRLSLIGIAVCPVGLFENIWDFSSSVCTVCPEGALCSANGLHNITNKRGYYQTPNTAIFTECYPKAACDVNNACGEGYSGNMCAKCSPQFFKKGGFCKPCGQSPSITSITQIGSVLLISFLAAFLLLIAAYLLRNAENGLVILFPFYIQVIGTMSTLKLNWPSLVTDFLGGFSLFNLNIETFEPECVGLAGSESIFELTFYTVLMTPLWVLFLSGIIAFIYFVWNTFYQIKLKKADSDVKEIQKHLDEAIAAQFNSSLFSSNASEEESSKFGSTSRIPHSVKESSPLNSTGAKKKKKTEERNYGSDKGFLHQLVILVLSVFDFLFFPLAFQSFAFLNCSYRSNLGYSIYEFASDRICYQDWWGGQSQFSIASIIIYLGGIVILVWGSQHSRKNILKLKHHDFSKAEEFLLRSTYYERPPFKSGLGYWNTMLLVRKFVIAVFFATLSYYPTIQMVLLISVLLTSLIANLKIEPFHLKEANIVDKVGTIFTTAFLLLGTVNYVGTTDAEQSNFSNGMTFTYFTLLIALLVAGMGLLFNVYLKCRKLKLKRQELLKRKVIKEGADDENDDNPTDSIHSGKGTSSIRATTSIHDSPTSNRLFPASPTIDLLSDNQRKHRSANAQRLDLKRSTERLNSMLQDKSKRASNPVSKSESVKLLELKKGVSIDDSLQKIMAARIILNKSNPIIKGTGISEVSVSLPSNAVETQTPVSEKADYVLNVSDRPLTVGSAEIPIVQNSEQFVAPINSPINSLKENLDDSSRINAAAATPISDTPISNLKLENLEKNEELEIELSEPEQITSKSPEVRPPSPSLKPSDSEKIISSQKSSQAVREQKSLIYTKSSEEMKSPDTPVTTLDLGPSSTDMNPLKIEKTSISLYSKISNAISSSKDKLSASLERMNTINEANKKHNENVPVFARKDAFGSNRSIDHPDALVKPSAVKKLESHGSVSSLANAAESKLGNSKQHSSRNYISAQSNFGERASSIDQGPSYQPTASSGTYRRETSINSLKNLMSERENNNSPTRVEPPDSSTSQGRVSANQNPSIMRIMGKRNASSSVGVNPRPQDFIREETPEALAKEKILNSSTKFGSITDVSSSVTASPSMQTIIPNFKSKEADRTSSVSMTSSSSPSGIISQRKISESPSETQGQSSSNIYRRSKNTSLSISATSSHASPPQSPTIPEPGSTLESPLSSLPSHPEEVTKSARKKVMKFSVAAPISTSPMRPLSGFITEESIGSQLYQLPDRSISSRPTPTSELPSFNSDDSPVSNKAVQARIAASKIKFANSDESISGGSKESMSKNSLSPKGSFRISPVGSSHSVDSGMKTEATIFKFGGIKTEKTIFKSADTNFSQEPTKLSDRAIFKLGSNKTGRPVPKDSQLKVETHRGRIFFMNSGVGGKEIPPKEISRSEFDKPEASSSKILEDVSTILNVKPSEISSGVTPYPYKPKKLRKDAPKPILSPISSASESYLESKTNESESPIQVTTRPLSILSSNRNSSSRPTSIVTNVDRAKSQRMTSPLVRESSSLEVLSAIIKAEAAPAEIVPKKSENHKKNGSNISTSSSVREIQEFSSMLGGVFGEGSSLFGDKSNDPFKLGSLKEETDD